MSCGVRTNASFVAWKAYLAVKAEQLSRHGFMVSDKQAQAIVGHIGIEVTDLGNSKRFYKALLGGLGFKVIMDTEDGAGFSNQNFSVWVGELRKSRVKREAPTGDEFVVADHLAILVQDKKAVYDIEKEMKKNGFEPLFPCEEHPQFEPGYYAVSFCDPDNYVVEVYTREKPKRF
jgi:catechol 2,3-dioxygenase-like lactoylglutathione lyase family enzyme